MPNETHLEKLLADRYEVQLSTFRDNYYLHVRDTKEGFGSNSKVVKRISITSDGLKALALVLPEILRIIDKGTNHLKKDKNDKDEYSEDDSDTELVRPLKKRKRQDS